MQPVDFLTTILSEKIRKKQKKTHKFNVIWQIVYIHENKKEDFYYI